MGIRVHENNPADNEADNICLKVSTGGLEYKRIQFNLDDELIADCKLDLQPNSDICLNADDKYCIWIFEHEVSLTGRSGREFQPHRSGVHFVNSFIFNEGQYVRNFIVRDNDTDGAADQPAYIFELTSAP